jgi:hypothetical protein
MKKTLILLLASLVLCGTASAVSIMVDCGGNVSPKSTNTLSATPITCNNAAQLLLTPVTAGYYISAVELLFQDSYSNGAPLNTNSFQFTWSAVPGAFNNENGGLVETVSGGADPTSWLPNTAYGGQSSFNGIWLVGVDTTPADFASIEASSAYNVGTVTGTGSLLSTAGTLNADAYMIFDESPITPEPATLTLIGGALLGLGIFGRKKFSRQ